MITPKEVKKGAMTEEKDKSDKTNPLVYYIGRPISYLIAAPLLSLGVTATQVTMFSLLPALLCIPVIAFAQNVPVRVLGGMLWGLWAILDYVDGNIARYTRSASIYGGLWDATCGYVAMWAWPISVGMAAFFDDGNALISLPIDAVIYVFLGGLTSIFAIFPRLVMHKAYSDLKNGNEKQFRDKSQYGFAKRIMLILIDPVSVPLYLFFISCYAHTMNLLIICYFMLYLVFCLASCYKIFSDVACSVGNK